MKSYLQFISIILLLYSNLSYSQDYKDRDSLPEITVTATSDKTYNSTIFKRSTLRKSARLSKGNLEQFKNTLKAQVSKKLVLTEKEWRLLYNQAQKLTLNYKLDELPSVL
ncbi:hypothetical protein [Nonlabens tegetincola]|uniref:hypothetical protein n=1 Tax=Nonlabens tegetincola TaxID=323273 RepID=UPI0030C813E7